MFCFCASFARFHNKYIIIYIFISTNKSRQDYLSFFIINLFDNRYGGVVSGNALASINSCATSDSVSIRMGDRLWTGIPSRHVTRQLGRLGLLPSVGR